MSPDRARLIRTLHAAARERGFDEDVRRDIMERATAKRSARDMSDAELHVAIEAVRGTRTAHDARPARKRRPAVGPATAALVAKMRALWITLYELGVVRARSDEALTAWCKTVTKVDALEWMSPHHANKAIEGLKSWAAREGVDWTAHDDPRRCVVEAQWRRLVAAGAITYGIAASPESWGQKVTGKGGFQFYAQADFDRLIRRLGSWLRDVQRKAAESQADEAPVG